MEPALLRALQRRGAGRAVAVKKEAPPGSPSTGSRTRGRVIKYIALMPSGTEGRPALRGAEGSDRGIPAIQAANDLEGHRKALLRALQLRGADRLGGALGAEDLLQSAFLDLVRRSDRLGARSLERWRAWISRRANDHLAKARARARYTQDVDALPDEPQSDDADPQAAWTRLEEARNVHALLRGATSEQRSLLYLTIVEEMSVAEASRRLSLSVSTARRRLEAALQLLMQSL